MVSAITMLVSVCTVLVVSTSVTSGAVDLESPTIQIVDSGGEVGRHSSLAIDSRDHAHISYYSISGASLRYANNSGGSWDAWTIDGGGDVGLFTSLALDSQDNAHISYFDSTNVDLKYALISGTVWSDHVIDGGDFVGYETSIALGSHDQIHISYYDFTNDDLKYATDALGPWTEWTIDGPGKVGGESSIVVDSQDRVHISYWDDTNDDLKYAVGSGGSWNIQVVDGSGVVGRYSSIAVDSQDHVHISYYDYASYDLKYATNSGGPWSIQTVDSEGDVGVYTSIAVDSQDHVHISYLDYTNYDLRYATNLGDAWQTWTIDSVGLVGSESSIALDSQDRVHISYWDASNSDLKYVTFSPLVVTAPGPPTGLNAVPGDEQVQLSWSAPADDGGSAIDHYVVYQDGTDIAHIAGTTKIITALTNGVSYDFAVAAHNSAGIGSPSATVSATPTSSVSVPGAPTGLKAIPGSVQVQLSWNAPVDDGGASITGYRLYWSQSQNGPFTVINVAVTSYLHAGLMSGSTYFYRVSAINQEGEGAISGTISSTTVIASSLPTIPLGLVATADSDSITLSWSAPADDGGSPITGYLIYRGTDTTVTGQIASVSLTSHTDTGLEKGVTYHYSVAAVNSIGAGPSAGPVDAALEEAGSPTGPSILPMEFIVGGLVIAAVAIAAALYLLRKRGSRPEE